MISLRQNQANVEMDETALTAFEVFGELLIQVLFCGEKHTDFVYGFHGLNNMTFFILVSFSRNNNPRCLKKHKSENALQRSCMSSNVKDDSSDRHLLVYSYYI